ncbi:GntR family transcriptional regulator [Streptomyces sp. NPDC006285]|uniref:GntR family transcriptional regulator n=1 Tax=Streptomyces sp. NPDC006285 TaxID=3364742 RepID=UPI0036A6F481
MSNKTASASRRTREKTGAVIQQRLDEGMYKPGTWLPPQRNLAAELGVSCATLELALQPFKASGVIVAMPRVGNVVADATSTEPIRYTTDNIARTLRKRLRDGTYAAGTPLPSQAQLAAEFGVSHCPVQIAVNTLRGEGLLASHAKAGTRAVVLPARKDDGVLGACEPTGTLAEPTTTPARRFKAKDVESVIRKRLSDGTYAAGTRLPAQPRIAAEFEVSLGTVAKALTRMRREGLLYSVRGAGTYVAALPQSTTGDMR